MTTGQPRGVTDCLGLRKTAEKGSAAARAASMKHLGAHGWEYPGAVRAETVGTSAAYKGTASIGNILKSDGRATTSVEWRANRLVDGLTKLAAGDGAAPRTTTTLLESAEALVRHAAAQLGAATHNTNNYAEEFTRDDGTMGKRGRRDTTDPPRATRSKELKPERRD